jgi:hypothetical protein
VPVVEHLSAARVRLMLPSWMRSSKGRSISRYFFATGMESLRFFPMSLDRAVLSPSLVLLPRLISSSCVRGLYNRSARSTSQEGLGSPSR